MQNETKKITVKHLDDTEVTFFAVLTEETDTEVKLQEVTELAAAEEATPEAPTDTVPQGVSPEANEVPQA